MCLTSKNFGQYYKAFLCDLHQHLCRVAELFVKHYNPNVFKKTGYGLVCLFNTIADIVTCLLDTNFVQSNITTLDF